MAACSSGDGDLQPSPAFMRSRGALSDHELLPELLQIASEARGEAGERLDAEEVGLFPPESDDEGHGKELLEIMLRRQIDDRATFKAEIKAVHDKLDQITALMQRHRRSVRVERPAEELGLSGMLADPKFKSDEAPASKHMSVDDASWELNRQLVKKIDLPGMLPNKRSPVFASPAVQMRPARPNQSLPEAPQEPRKMPQIQVRSSTDNTHLLRQKRNFSPNYSMLDELKKLAKNKPGCEEKERLMEQPNHASKGEAGPDDSRALAADKSADVDGEATNMRSKSVRKASLSGAFREREQQLTSVIGKPAGTPLNPPLEDPIVDDGPASAKSQQVVEERITCAWVSRFNAPAFFTIKLCGLLPWFPPDKTRSRAAATISRAYHLTMLLLNAVLLCMSVGSLVMSRVSPDGSAIWAVGHVSATDVAVAGGSLCVLMCCGGTWSYRRRTARLHESMTDLSNYCRFQELEELWEENTGADALVMLLMWASMLAARCFTIASHGEPLQMMEKIHLLLYMLAATNLLSAGFLVAYIARGMSLMVDEFALNFFQEDVTVERLRAHWRIACGCMRKTSRSLQLCLAALSGTASLIPLVFLYDLDQSMAWAVPSNIVVVVSLAAVCLVAASTTAACTKLPSFVSLLDPGEELAGEYMDLALFLHFSEAGFYVYDTRLTQGLVQKFIYFTAAISFTLGSKLFNVI